MAGHRTDLTVLLVEDNPGDADLVEHHLNDPAISHFVDDVSMTHVEGMTAAEAEMAEEGYDVLLLDLGLEATSGLATLDRAREFVEDEPIIILTGLDDRETAMDAIERGAQDYLPKRELDGDRLVRALRYAVVRRSQERALERREEQMKFFNSVLRHDMLNGMNVIASRSRLLEEELGGEQREHAETIAKWSDDIVELTRTVRSVLETLSTDSTRELEPMVLAPIVEDVRKRVQTMAPEATVRTSVPEDLAVRADGLLGDVFGNIGTNAIEHGEEVSEVAIEATASPNVVTVRFADDGSGIAPDRRKEVFGRGQKGDRSSGTGFGLYFVGSMIDAYGGDVWIEDSDLGGVAFVVELPPA